MAVTLSQLRSEPFWRNETVPPNLTEFVFALADHFGLPHGRAGTVGNFKHLEGRHRSIEWSLNSAFCTDRKYGTQDRRDTRGNHRHIRAVDLTWIVNRNNQDQIAKAKAEFHPLCHRLDNAVRAGLLPQVAEWFGTFNGNEVSGWSKGGPDSSDSSHLNHLHIGFWTENADDDHSDIFGILTESVTPPGDDMSVADVRTGLHQILDEAAKRSTPTGRQYGDDFDTLIRRSISPIVAQIAALTGKNMVDEKEIAKAVLAGLQPATIADFVMEAMPASASEIVDELTSRINDRTPGEGLPSPV
ncbi:hypothetical protein EV384_3528 [Micromonospora kangleipakensis]|uniref:Uncharacterized protein n=1 Tax=Micromonospora kangleipakensis TaxID=1077942 RepID=A0A4V2GD93_9ACTN|nr:hypothetical protein [Micromonospora kangleipakensis]RZU75016.1 hypothetical protein EV384_3528 [Micromonospora kangleipakensis]